MKILIQANKDDDTVLGNCDTDSCYSDCPSYYRDDERQYRNANESYEDKYDDNKYDDSHNSYREECSDGD